VAAAAEGTKCVGPKGKGSPGLKVSVKDLLQGQTPSGGVVTSEQKSALFQIDALAEAAMLWIPSGVVRSESWLLNKDSDTLTTVHTCCGKQCRSEKRWRQFGRAAELLEHLAEEEQFRFLPCPAPGCDEWHWDCRLLDHFRHAHQDRVAVVQQRRRAFKGSVSAEKTKSKRQTKSKGKKAVESGRKAKRLAEAKAAPGGIVTRSNGWTKSSSSAASDSGVSVTTSLSSASPAVARKSAATPSVAELRKKVLAWDASTMAERSKPLVVKKHFCSHAACNLAKRSFKSVAAVKDHIADAHSQ